MIDIKLPLRIPSPNSKEHWTKTHKRNKRIKVAVGFSLKTHRNIAKIEQFVSMNTRVPDNTKKIVISLIRSGMRNLDYDNFVFSMKPVRDAVSSYFFPHLAAGQADGLEIFKFIYLQEKGSAGIKIFIKLEDT